MKRIRLVALLLAAMAWVPCMAEDGGQSNPRGECFDIRQVRDWDALDNRHLYIEVSAKKRYLLTLFSECRGIRFAQAIALSNQTGRVCRSDLGTVTFRDGQRTARCTIVDIQSVADREAARALLEAESATQDEAEDAGFPEDQTR